MKILLLFIFIAFRFSLSSSDFRETLKTMPPEDREDINHLFHFLSLQNDGSYTIFGDKAVSVAAISPAPSWEPAAIYHGKILKSWSIWKKYFHLFPMNNILIISEKFHSNKADVDGLYIFIINKKGFIETINAHLALFESILKMKINPEDLLCKIQKGQTSFLKSIRKNELLFGVLLGYGQHNAMLYQKKMKSSQLGRGVFLEARCLKCTEMDYYPMMTVNPVQFLADPNHPITKRLQKRYQKLHQNISRIYYQDDILEVTFSACVDHDT